MPTSEWRPPPNWPVPPQGWTPPPGWQPDPAWGPAPPGWSFWSVSATEQDVDDPGDEDNDLVLGHRAARKWRRTQAGLRACLQPGEAMRGFFLANTLRPMTDYIAVTSERVLAGHVADLAHAPPGLRSARLHDIVALNTEPATISRLPKLSVRCGDGSEVFLGQLMAGEDELLLRRAAGIPDAPSTVASPPAPSPSSPRKPSVVTTRAPEPSAAERVPVPEVRADGRKEEMEARIRRLVDEAVIDDAQAHHVRSVLFP
ncbi:hypothetical protein [Pseudonocardia sp. ICBG1034]|uniref:hypothetical protein n=1 Tax=Pseudonocardia sp. ICBG1034 TaxID=2844381 RepID=UPI001CC976DC|nr:hypothetical protein [Pseudonocardia sp. ICBG1034]